MPNSKRNQYSHDDISCIPSFKEKVEGHNTLYRHNTTLPERRHSSPAKITGNNNSTTQATYLAQKTAEYFRKTEQYEQTGIPAKCTSVQAVHPPPKTTARNIGQQTEVSVTKGHYLQPTAYKKFVTKFLTENPLFKTNLPDNAEEYIHITNSVFSAFRRYLDGASKTHFTIVTPTFGYYATSCLEKKVPFTTVPYDTIANSINNNTQDILLMHPIIPTGNISEEELEGLMKAIAKENNKRKNRSERLKELGIKPQYIKLWVDETFLHLQKPTQKQKKSILNIRQTKLSPKEQDSTPIVLLYSNNKVMGTPGKSASFVYETPTTLAPTETHSSTIKTIEEQNTEIGAIPSSMLDLAKIFWTSATSPETNEHMRKTNEEIKLRATKLKEKITALNQKLQTLNAPFTLEMETSGGPFAMIYVTPKTDQKLSYISETPHGLKVRPLQNGFQLGQIFQLLGITFSPHESFFFNSSKIGIRYLLTAPENPTTSLGINEDQLKPNQVFDQSLEKIFDRINKNLHLLANKEEELAPLIDFQAKLEKINETFNSRWRSSPQTPHISHTIIYDKTDNTLKLKIEANQFTKYTAEDLKVEDLSTALDYTLNTKDISTFKKDETTVIIPLSEIPKLNRITDRDFLTNITKLQLLSNVTTTIPHRCASALSLHNNRGVTT